jgi:hypothetical protein
MFPTLTYPLYPCSLEYVQKWEYPGYLGYLGYRPAPRTKGQPAPLFGEPAATTGLIRAPDLARLPVRRERSA